MFKRQIFTYEIWLGVNGEIVMRWSRLFVFSHKVKRHTMRKNYYTKYVLNKNGNFFELYFKLV